MSDDERRVWDEILLGYDTRYEVAVERVVEAGGDPSTILLTVVADDAWEQMPGVRFLRPETAEERVAREVREAERREALRRWREEHPGQEPPSWGRIVNGVFAELDTRVVVSAERPKDASEGTVWIQA